MLQKDETKLLGPGARHLRFLAWSRGPVRRSRRPGPRLNVALPRVRAELGELQTFTHEVFRALKLSDEQAQMSAHALIYSELRFHPGQGQGVRRLTAYRERLEGGLIDKDAPFEIVKESPALALVDAHNGLGSVSGVKAARRAVQKAKTCGIVVVRGGTHYGSSAVHASEALKEGCLGVALTNAGPEMAAWGGATPVVGTNPWAIAAPSDKGFPGNGSISNDIQIIANEKTVKAEHVHVVGFGEG